MELRVGLVGEDSGWEELLLREGIPFAPASGPFRPDEWAMLVVADSTDPSRIRAVRTYLNDGGSVLASSVHAGGLAEIATKRRHVGTITPARAPTFALCDPIDIDRPLDVPSGANVASELGGSPTVLAGRHGSGYLVLLPFDAPSLIADERARQVSFPSPMSRLPFERVSVVSKGEVRVFVARAIELLFHRRGLPFAHIWYYPDGAPSVFAFRVDTDEADDPTVRALYEIARTERVPMTWFVHVERQRSFLRTFAAMEGQEIGVHCFAHRSFATSEEISNDLRSATVALLEQGLDPVGYAAPYGRWSRELTRALLGAGFSYSSEFAYAHDDLPLSLGSARQRMLQIPVHPICLGSMRRQSYTEGEATAYFSAVLDRAVARRMPALFYHHPNDGHPDVLRALFARVRKAGIPMMTMSGYAGWWTERAQWTLRAQSGPNAVILSGSVEAPSGRVRISLPEGTERLVAGAGRVELGGEGWSKVSPPSPDPNAVRARRFNPRIPMVLGLDAVVHLFKRKD